MAADLVLEVTEAAIVAVVVAEAVADVVVQRTVRKNGCPLPSLAVS